MLDINVTNESCEDDVKSEEMIDYLHEVIEDQDDDYTHLMGIMAVMRDAVGQMIMCLNSSHSVGNLDKAQLLQSIDKTFAPLPIEMKRFIKKSTEFHLAANKFNQTNPELSASWRDDHPLRDLEGMNLLNIVNRCY